MMVKRFAYAFFWLCALSSPGIAETRWCSIAGKLAGEALYYPPIARAAKVPGTVIERITFTPNGPVIGAETVLGPRLIAPYVATQLKKWSIKTNDKGDQPCQALVIADFAFGDFDSYAETWTASSIAKVSIFAKPLILYSMPAVSGN